MQSFQRKSTNINPDAAITKQNFINLNLSEDITQQNIQCSLKLKLLYARVEYLYWHWRVINL